LERRQGSRQGGITLAAARGNPKILAFVCSWHPLAAADNAGADGRSYGTGTSLVPVDCAGVVSGAAVVKAFANGVDGVLIAACGRGDCHYSNGNESCERVVEETREILRLAGIEPVRLRLDLSSDVDGGRFVELLEEFSAEISGLKVGLAKRKATKKAGKRAKKAVAKKARKAAPKKAKKAVPKKAKKAAPKKAKKAAAKKSKKAAPKKAKKAAPKKAKKTGKAAPKKTKKTTKGSTGGTAPRARRKR
jgi:F420-non-reducing hydrogenase iron-sulfur subunit